MSDLDALGDFSNIDPKQFAQLVKGAADSQLGEIMNSPQRKTILDTIFSRFPELFRPDRAGATNAVIHWNINGAADGGVDSYELVIADGKCVLSPSPDHEKSKKGWP